MIMKTNLADNKLTKQLPPFIGQDPYINELLRVKMNEYSSLEEMEADVEKQFFVDTATWGLAFWEKSLNLPVVKDQDQEFMKVEEDNPDIHYYGKWAKYDLSNEASFKAYNMTSNGLIASAPADDENWLEYTFWGSGIRVVSTNINREYCDAKIVIDDKEYQCCNYNNGYVCVEKTIFEETDLSWGSHTIRIITQKNNDPNINNKFTFDRFEILNALEESYEKRRKTIKARLMPIRKVTRQTILDLGSIYGFDDMTIDESEAGCLKIEFDSKTIDASLRKNLLRDIKVLIPAHLELKNKFLVSTFHDIDNEQLTWQEITDNGYTFNDFLLSGVSDPKSIYTQLYKYMELSVFNYQSFNTDLVSIDNFIKVYYYDNLHTGNRILHKNIAYDIDYKDLTDAKSIADYLSNTKRKLLTDPERVRLYSLSNANVTKFQNDPTFTEPVQKYEEAIENLKDAINKHPYLQSKNVKVTSDKLADLIAPTNNFTGKIDYGTDDSFILTPEQVAPGKTAFNGETYLTSDMKEYDLDKELLKLKDDPDGFVLKNVYTSKDFNLPVQTGLVPDNIVKGVKMYGVTGTFEVPSSDFYIGDYVLYEDAYTSDGKHYFKITSF